MVDLSIAMLNYQRVTPKRTEKVQFINYGINIVKKYNPM